MPKDQCWRAQNIDPNDKIYLKACTGAKTINPIQNCREVTATIPRRHPGRPRGSVGKEPKKAYIEKAYANFQGITQGR
jgi:hypothetical protein